VNADDGSDEVRSQTARRQLQAEPAPLHDVVVADAALLLDAENDGPRGRPVADEARPLLLGCDGEGGVVLWDARLGKPAIGGLEFAVDGLQLGALVGKFDVHGPEFGPFIREVNFALGPLADLPHQIGGKTAEQ
jgi:hypothetical protein